MKKHLYASVILSCFLLPAVAQTTLTLQPDAAAGKDANLYLQQPAVPRPDDPNFIANAWTANGGYVTQRSLVEFDLSSIPANAVITSAKLYLYCNTTSAHSQLHSSWNGSPYPLSNGTYLRRITAPWSENTVTWNNQPSVDTTHQVLLPATVSQTQDVIVDVKQLIADMVANPASFHGFMFGLQDEVLYRTMVFASSDHPDIDKHPQLQVTYTVPSAVNSVRIQGPEVSIYPNPAAETIFIQLNNRLAEQVQICLMDAAGKVFAKLTNTPGRPDEKLSIPVADLAAGVYFVEAVGERSGKTVRPVNIR